MAKIEKFRRTLNCSPNILGRTIVDIGKIKGRGYIHSYGFEEYGSLGNASEYLGEALFSNEGFFGKFDYVLSILWGEKGSKFIDTFGYAFNNPNSLISNIAPISSILEEGSFSDIKSPTCEDGFIILSEEGRHRRMVSKNLKDYLDNPPVSIWGLELL